MYDILLNKAILNLIFEFEFTVRTSQSKTVHTQVCTNKHIWVRKEAVIGQALGISYQPGVFRDKIEKSDIESTEHGLVYI